VKSLFPAFLKLEARPVLVVGAGKVGEPKSEGLLATGARVTVVAVEAGQAAQELARTGAISLQQRAFCPADLDGVFLAVVATASRGLNEFVFNEAKRRGVLCNVVDVPVQCDFFYPAVVRANCDFDVRAEPIAGAAYPPAIGAALASVRKQKTVPSG
jgi:precorrin-2 dehydrogenase / sirohydrochlorin ferrochelatase